MPVTTKDQKKEETIVRKIVSAITTTLRVIAMPTRITAQSSAIALSINATTGWRLRAATILRIHHPIGEIVIAITTGIAMDIVVVTGIVMEHTAGLSISVRQH